jgi:hypothetical protein
MIGEFFARVPGQRPVKFAGQSLRLLDERRDDVFGILVRDLDQHHIARMALDKRCDIAVARFANQVALPVAMAAPKAAMTSPSGESLGFGMIASVDAWVVRLSNRCSNRNSMTSGGQRHS